jgi:hypothetical protein
VNEGPVRPWSERLADLKADLIGQNADLDGAEDDLNGRMHTQRSRVPGTASPLGERIPAGHFAKYRSMPRAFHFSQPLVFTFFTFRTAPTSTAP